MINFDRKSKSLKHILSLMYYFDFILMSETNICLLKMGFGLCYCFEQSPRRNCCRVEPSKEEGTMVIDVGECRKNEFAHKQRHGEQPNFLLIILMFFIIYLLVVFKCVEYGKDKCYMCKLVFFGWGFCDYVKYYKLHWTFKM